MILSTFDGASSTVDEILNNTGQRWYILMLTGNLSLCNGRCLEKHYLNPQCSQCVKVPVSTTHHLNYLVACISSVTIKDKKKTRYRTRS